MTLHGHRGGRARNNRGMLFFFFSKGEHQQARGISYIQYAIDRWATRLGAVGFIASRLRLLERKENAHGTAENALGLACTNYSRIRRIHGSSGALGAWKPFFTSKNGMGGWMDRWAMPVCPVLRVALLSLSFFENIMFTELEFELSIRAASERTGPTGPTGWDKTDTTGGWAGALDQRSSVLDALQSTSEEGRGTELACRRRRPSAAHACALSLCLALNTIWHLNGTRHLGLLLASTCSLARFFACLS